MDNVLKNLKSIFIIEEEQATEKPSPKKEQSASKSSAKASNQGLKANTGKVTQKFTDVLFGALEKNNIDGFDYLEYKKSLKKLSKMPMDEPTRYQSAFAMASTLGATPQVLVETAQHYVNVLKQEEAKFQQALVNQRKQQIGDKESQIAQIEKVIQQKAEQIKKLTQEIQSHQKQTSKLSQEISQATVKVEQTKNNFKVSLNALLSQITKDVENMKKYLK